MDLERKAMMRWVVAYDIPDDRRRLKVATLLQGFGDRVQHSVFEAVLEGRDRAALEAELKKILFPEEDRLRMYPLCNSCANAVTDLGLVLETPFAEPDVIIV